MAVKVNKIQFDKMMDELEKMPVRTIRTAGKYFKNITPVRSGNARSKTKTYPNQGRIYANYGYADSLDNGHSKQAPNGMSDPTIDIIEQFIEGYVRNL